MEKMVADSDRHRVLVIDDDKSFCLVVEKVAAKVGVDLEYITKADDLERIDVLEDFDAIWIDYDLNETTGLELAERLDEEHPSIPVVIISSTNRPFSDDMKMRKNIKGILSKWELTDEDISNDLLENALGHFHSADDLHTSGWQNENEESIEKLKDHFTQTVPVEKYRA